MSGLSGLLLLAAGIGLVVVGADAFFAGLLASASRLRVSAFVLAVVVSGFELENLAAGIAADLKGLPNVAAGTFLGGTTFLAVQVRGQQIEREAMPSSEKMRDGFPSGACLLSNGVHF